MTGAESSRLFLWRWARPYLLICGYIACFSFVHGQSTSRETSWRKSDQYFDLVLIRSALLNQPESDSIPILGKKSGTTFLGAGISVDIWKERFGLRLQPGLAWMTLRYAQRPEKTFPEPLTGLEKEKHLMTYAMLPIGLYLALTTDRKSQPGLFLEAGVYGGYRIGGIYKTHGINDRGQKVTGRVRNVADLETYPYGFYGRLGYKRAAVQIGYRHSQVFTPFKSRPDNSLTEYRNPVLTPYEIGAVVIF